MLVHVAVPRTGSTSTRSILKRVFRGRLAGAVGCTVPQAAEVLRVELGRERRQLPAAAVSGHFPYGLWSPYQTDHTQTVTTSRDPLARVVSCWRFSHRLHEQPFEEWTESAGAWAHNHVTRHLAGGPVAYPRMGILERVTPEPLPALDESMFRLACDNLRECVLVGVVERFSAFQRQLERLLDAGELADAEVSPFGMGTHGLPSTDEIVDTMRESLRQRLIDMNAFDVRLHDVARELAP